MACPDETTVVAFIDGKLPSAEADAVEEHLAGCSECRELVSALARSSLLEAAGGGGAVAEATPAPLERRPGAVVAGRYLLERCVGEGGIGAVWTAKHLRTRRTLALKFLKGSSTERERRRVLREARASNAVDHPNVLPVADVLELPDGSPVLVMDFLAGESLGKRLHREGALPLGETARLLSPVVSAVAAAHAAGIVHRDLKPDNIFLVEGGDVKVLDFGIAKLTAAEGDAAQTGDLTQTGEMVGTPCYMSPEQAFGETDIDRRSDVWALGVILYECLTGRRPFAGSNLGQVIKAVTAGKRAPLVELVPALPYEVWALVERMLTVERADRPADLRELEAVLGRWAGVATPAAPVVARGADRFAVATTVSAPGIARPPAATTARVVKRRRWPVAVALGAAIAAAAGIVGWRVAHRGPSPSAPAPVPVPVPASVPASASVPVPVPVPVPGSAQVPVSPAVSGPHGAPPARHRPPAAPPPGPAAPAPARTPSTLPGGVLDDVPF